MKERRDSIAVRIADTIAGGVRRRQQGREPRALVYDATGEPRLVRAGTDEQRGLVATAEAAVAIAFEDVAQEVVEQEAAALEVDDDEAAALEDEARRLEPPG